MSYKGEGGWEGVSRELGGIKREETYGELNVHVLPLVLQVLQLREHGLEVVVRQLVVLAVGELRGRSGDGVVVCGLLAGRVLRLGGEALPEGRRGRDAASHGGGGGEEDA